VHNSSFTYQSLITIISKDNHLLIRRILSRRP